MNKDLRPHRNVNALRAAARRLRHEWDTARFAADAVNQAIDTVKPFVTDVTLDAFLIHARNLRDFFAPTGGRDDILSRDLLGRSVRVSLPLLRSPKVRRGLIHRLGHPRYSRIERDPIWDVTAIAAELDRAMERFVAQLRAQRPDVAKDIF